MSEANKLFEEVLSRRERADATRSALAVLQRFRFLFGLPGAIEKNIKKGDYDAVINDYARVMNLFGNTDVPVSKKLKKIVLQCLLFHYLCQLWKFVLCRFLEKFLLRWNQELPNYVSFSITVLKRLQLL